MFYCLFVLTRFFYFIRFSYLFLVSSLSPFMLKSLLVLGSWDWQSDLSSLRILSSNFPLKYCVSNNNNDLLFLSLSKFLLLTTRLLIQSILITVDLTIFLEFSLSSFSKQFNVLNKLCWYKYSRTSVRLKSFAVYSLSHCF
jgi:hypothetical protein